MEVNGPQGHEHFSSISEEERSKGFLENCNCCYLFVLRLYEVQGDLSVLSR